jgi:hypothetical protein
MVGPYLYLRIRGEISCQALGLGQALMAVQ